MTQQIITQDKQENYKWIYCCCRGSLHREFLFTKGTFYITKMFDLFANILILNILIPYKLLLSKSVFIIKLFPLTKVVFIRVKDMRWFHFILTVLSNASHSFYSRKRTSLLLHLSLQILFLSKTRKKCYKNDEDVHGYLSHANDNNNV